MGLNTYIISFLYLNQITEVRAMKGNVASLPPFRPIGSPKKKIDGLARAGLFGGCVSASESIDECQPSNSGDTEFGFDLP